MFKKGDYIVCLEGNFTNANNEKSTVAGKNYIVKQYTTDNYLRVCVGLDNIIEKANDDFTFDKKRKLKDWRYATKEEIKHYDKIGKPYDVTTLANDENLVCGINLIHGKYYALTTGFKWIIKFNKIQDNYCIKGSYMLDVSSGRFDTSYSNSIDIHREIREATQEEIQWLDACIKANKFISLEDIKKMNNQLEVGFWYKVKGGSIPAYRKVLTIDIGGDFITYNDGITNGKYENQNSSCHGLSRLEKVSLEEIQQYLPHGHPDKNETLPSNRYLKALVDNPVGIPIKKGEYLYTLSDNTVRASDYRLWSVSYYYIYNYVLELMPEGFKPTESITSFRNYKIGDKIQPIQSGANDSTHKFRKRNYTYEDVENNLILEIEGFDLDSSNKYQVAICREGYVLRIEECYTCFKKVEEEWNPEVGDWIYIIDASEGAYGANSKIGKILNYKTNYVGGLNHGTPYSNFVVLIDKQVWGIGENAKVRKALPHEIPADSTKMNILSTTKTIKEELKVITGVISTRDDRSRVLIQDYLSESTVDIMKDYSDSFNNHDEKVELLIPNQNNTLDTKVNKVNACSIELIEPNKVVLF